MKMAEPVTLEEEFQKNKDLKKDELDALISWYRKQSHFPQKVTDKTLALFLHSCYYRQEAAKVTIDNYFTVRTHVPEFFDNRDPLKANINKKNQTVVDFFMLPGKTDQGDRVVFVKIHITDPSDFNFNEALREFIICTDIELHCNGTADGLIIVFDMDGMAFGHLAKLNILSVKKILYYLQEALPVRLTGLHFINVVPFMDKILAMMRPFMKKQLLESLHLHMKSIEELYPYVPQRMLPAEYGGENPTTAQLRDEHRAKKESNKQFFIEEAELRVIESNRPGKAKNAGEIFGVEGSFKKLDLD